MAEEAQVGLSEISYHYEDMHEIPKEVKKYWLHRYDIFSLYDEGIWMTEDGWFGVTPEPVADSIAAYLAEAIPTSKSILIDAFAGMGGNAIAFARSGRWERIFAIERDAKALQCAKHNAELYGVSNKIWWIEGDCFDVIKTRLSSIGKTAVIFASPPWGGPGYMTDPVFDLNAMEPYSLQAMYQPFSKLTPDVVLYLPRTSDITQLAQLVPVGTKIPVIQYCVRGHTKALCAYFGSAAVP